MRASFQLASASGTITGSADAAETVVLVHGANGHAGEWDLFADALAAGAPDAGTRAIAVDLPHHGSASSSTPFDLDACRDTVLAAMDGLSVERAHLVGSSFGGLVVLSLAADTPDRVASVTTLGTSDGGDTLLADAIAAAIDASGARAFYEESIPRYSYPAGTAPAVLADAIERAAAPGDAAAIEIVRTAFGTSAEVISAPLQVPTLVVGGAEDSTCPPERVTALASLLGTAPLIVPGLAHLPHLEAPDRIAALLRRHWALPVEPERTVADLAALETMTRDENGVQRLCWSETWSQTRQWYRRRLAEVPGVRIDRDAAGNLHATLPGRSRRTVVIGSHLDSVPSGGNLDGGYGVMAGLEVLRAAARRGVPLPVTLRLTDWADEEGARFGRSLFGSSAVAGTLDVASFRGLVDAGGDTSERVLARHDVDLDRIDDARVWMRDVVAYLELHIEQGPRLEAAGRTLAAVTGSLGVERHSIRMHGVPSHAGGTPMALRADPVQAAARFLVAARERVEDAGGLFTSGVFAASPGTPTAIAETVTFTVDIRHDDASALSRCWSELAELLAAVSAEERVDVATEVLWQIAPVHFDAGLIGRALEVVTAFTGSPERLMSGPLHDACEMSGAGIPTVMLFVPSIGGISHAPDEDTAVPHLRDGVRALAALLDDVSTALGIPEEP